MPRDYRIERDAIIRRWYGGNPGPQRRRKKGPITPADCLGIPLQVNPPFVSYGYCMVWKYTLNLGGYGFLRIDGKQVLAHRAVFCQTRGPIPEDLQVNHLCNRPYCVQPSHLYAGTRQDNKDDAQIFSKEHLIHAPWVLHFPDMAQSDDPLTQRLLESKRNVPVEPWEPVEHPAQQPLEEFTCPGHDFAITMLGGHSKICRICETSEFQEEMVDEFGAYSPIAGLCPVSQAVTPIFEKISTSEFLEESYREIRLRAYYRSRPGLGFGSHDLRECGCGYCTQDRRTFRDVVHPRLTLEESRLLDFCDHLAPQISAALYQASADIVVAWAESVGLSNDQRQSLREHHKDCVNTRANLTRTCRDLERQLGYMLYAFTTFDSPQRMLEDEVFQSIISFGRFVRVRTEDKERVLGTILPAAEKMADRITLEWEKEANELLRPYVDSKREFHEGNKFLVQMLVKTHTLEHLRYEFFGRDSFNESIPHPHHGCAASIVETGRVQPFLTEFEEGKGYVSRGL